MKVLIVNNMVPFGARADEELAVYLQANLSLAGHESEILRIPYQRQPAARIPAQMLMTRAFELSNVDQVIALTFPAYLIRHQRKTLWLPYPGQACDPYDTEQATLPAGTADDQLQAYIRRADREVFAESRHVFAGSELARQRLLKYSGFDARVLPPPISDPQIFTDEAPGDYIFAGGRVNGTQRQKLLLEALALADRRVKLIIAGPPDAPADAEELQKMVVDAGLADRVKLDLRFVPRSLHAAYVNRSAAVVCVPVAEDGLSPVVMEAAIAGKALIGTGDSTGILGLVKAGETGWVVQPSAMELAKAMNAVYEDRTLLAQYGAAARSLWHSSGINWPRTIEALLQ